MEQDLNCINAFAKVAELGSFRQAAKALNTPVSTVSNRVARLEETLKVTLLDRSTRTVRLTEVGQSYLTSVTPALDALSNAANLALDNEQNPTGILKISSPIEFGVHYLPKVISEYKNSCPSVEIDCQLSNRRVQVLEEGFDVVVRAGFLDDSSLICRGVGTPQILMTCASPDYLKLHDEPKKPADLQKHDCLVMGGSQEPNRWNFMVNKKITATKIAPTVMVNNYSVLIELAQKHLGIINAPLFMVEPLIATGKLQQVLTNFTLAPRQFQALYPQSGRSSPKVQLFLEALDKCIVT